MSAQAIRPAHTQRNLTPNADAHRIDLAEKEYRSGVFRYDPGSRVTSTVDGLPNSYVITARCLKERANAIVRVFVIVVPKHDVIALCIPQPDVSR